MQEEVGRNIHFSQYVLHAGCLGGGAVAAGKAGHF